MNNANDLNCRHYISNSLEKTHRMLSEMQQDTELIESIEKSLEAIYHCLSNDHKILFSGNGGSAADAQHMSTEFVSRFMFDRPGLPSIALTTDTSVLTAIGNDYGFDCLFSRQIEALGRSGDVLIAYSTSGTSPNILKAIRQAKKQRITTIGLTGQKKCSQIMTSQCDIAIRIPSDCTPRIQEGHLMVGHILCGAIEEKMFKNIR